MPHAGAHYGAATDGLPRESPPTEASRGARLFRLCLCSKGLYSSKGKLAVVAISAMPPQRGSRRDVRSRAGDRGHRHRSPIDLELALVPANLPPQRLTISAMLTGMNGAQPLSAIDFGGERVQDWQWKQDADAHAGCRRHRKACARRGSVASGSGAYPAGVAERARAVGPAAPLRRLVRLAVLAPHAARLARLVTCASWCLTQSAQPRTHHLTMLL